MTDIILANCYQNIKFAKFNSLQKYPAIGYYIHTCTCTCISAHIKCILCIMDTLVQEICSVIQRCPLCGGGGYFIQ